MSDVATLGIAFDGTQLERGRQQLAALNKEAAKTPAVTRDIEEAAKRAGVSVDAMRQRIANAGDNVATFEKKGRTATDMVDKMAAASLSANKALFQQADAMKATGAANDNFAAQIKGASAAALLAYGQIVFILGVAAQAVTYLMGTVKTKSEEADEALKAQETILGQVKAAYEAAGQAAAGLTQGQANVAIIQQIQALSQIKEGLAAEAAKTLKSTIDYGQLVVGAVDVRERFKPFSDAIFDLNDSLQKGTPNVARFREQVAGIAIANPELAKTAAELLASSAKAAEFFEKAAQGEDMIAVLRGIADQAQRVHAGLAAAADPRATFAGAVKSLEDLNPKLDESVKKQHSLTDAYKQYEVALAAIKQFDPGQRAGLEAQANATLKATIAGINTEKEKEAAHYARAIDQAGKNIAVVTAEGQAAGASAGMHAKLRLEAQLWEAATQDGKPKTAALSAEIAAMGDRARDAATDLEKAKLAAQIDFTSKTMFLSSEDTKIAQQLVGIYGNDVPAALASAEAEVLRLQMRQKAMFDEAKAGANAFLGSLASGLLQNKSLVDSLHDAFNSLAQMATNAAINNLLNGNLGMAAVDAAVAIGSKLASGLFDDSQQKELEKAQAAWKDMAEEVSPFNTQAPAKREPANDNKEKRDDRDQWRRAA